MGRVRTCRFPRSRNPAGAGWWWSRTVSNRRPHACKARALPTELRPPTELEGARPTSRVMVGPGGLEPPTSRLSGVCSNQLSYRPERCAPPPAAPHEEATAAEASAIASRSEPPEEATGTMWERETETAAFRTCVGVFERTSRTRRPWRLILRKEVIQPQVPLRLPCYDFTPVADPTVVACPLAVSEAPSGRTNSHGVTGGVYKARERIHRGMLIRDY